MNTSILHSARRLSARRTVARFKGFAVMAAATACATPPAAPSSQPASAASQPVLAAGNSAAHKLGRRIVKNSGFKELSQVAQLDFEFVVTDAKKPVFSARHRWDMQNGRDRVSWKDKAGIVHEAWLDIATRTAVGTKNGEWVTGPEKEELARKAYGRYINDTYWLMMPLKLFDPGTRLSLEDDETVDGTTYNILRIAFDGVGLTPGDVYRLYVDDGGFRIHGWQMLLQGRPDKPSYVTWEDYRPVGPLLLAHLHRIEGTERAIVMEGTLAHRTVVEQVFAPPTPAP